MGLQARLVLVFTVLLQILGMSMAQKVTPPRINPYSEDFETVPNTPHLLTNSTQRFRLLCEGQQPVIWTSPIKNEENRTSVRTWEQNTNVEYPYASHLLVENASYEDTGNYTCTDATNTSSSVYIYVYDKSHLLVGEDRTIDTGYTVIQFASVTIDCRPTSPEVSVSLWLDDTERVDVVYDPTQDANNVSFDPTKGFTIEITDIGSILYECRGELGNKTDVHNFYLDILAVRDPLQKPLITGGKEVVEEGNLNLNCTVTVDISTYFSMTWDVPDQNAIQEKRINIMKSSLVRNPNGSFIKKVGLSVLNIASASKADQGNYTCIIKDHAGNVSSQTTFIAVLGKNQTTAADGELSVL